jgi:hypothetical protein
VTFTATVTGATPGGTVTFTINGVDQAPATVSSNGIAVLSTAALAAGTANVTARYSGDTNNTPSTSAPVSQQVGVTASTVTLSAAPNPAAPNTFVTLTATVTGFIPTGVVTFLEGNAVLGSGTVTGGTATLVIPQSKKGSRQLSASYGGDSNNLASTSPRIRLTTK